METGKEIKNISIISSAVVLLIFISTAVGATASFQGLGGPSSKAYGVSADGSVVVGESDSQAFRWTSATGMTGLGYLHGELFSSAYSVSADGSIVVGSSYSDFDGEAFRWTSATGMTGLGHLPGGAFSSAYAVSADGSTAVGGASSASGIVPFRWTSSTGMTSLGSLPDYQFWCEAYAVSADGSVVYGESQTSPGPYEAFRWTAADGMTGLGDFDFPGDILLGSRAYDVSADGSTVVGSGSSDLGYEACTWTSEGITGLGDLPGGAFWSRAQGVSADGSVIVGFGTTDPTSLFWEGEAFYWTPEGGMQNLKDILTNSGLDLTGWTLRKANDVSADGLTVVGYGINPQGQTEAWIATIPEPATVALFYAGILAFRKRKNSK